MHNIDIKVNTYYRSKNGEMKTIKKIIDTCDRECLQKIEKGDIEKQRIGNQSILEYLLSKITRNTINNLREWAKTQNLDKSQEKQNIWRRMLLDIIGKQPKINKLDSSEKKKLTVIFGYYLVHSFGKIKNKDASMIKYLIKVKVNLDTDCLIKFLFTARMHPYYIKQIINNIKQNFMMKVISFFNNSDPFVKHYSTIFQCGMLSCFAYDKDIKSGGYSALAKKIQATPASSDSEYGERLRKERKFERKRFSSIFDEHTYKISELKKKLKDNFLKLPRRSDFLPDDMRRTIYNIFKLYLTTTSEDFLYKKNVVSFIECFVDLATKKVKIILDYLDNSNVNSDVDSLKKEFLYLFFNHDSLKVNFKYFDDKKKDSEVIDLIYNEATVNNLKSQKNKI